MSHPYPLAMFNRRDTCVFIEGTFIMGVGYWTSKNIIYYSESGEILTDMEVLGAWCKGHSSGLQSLFQKKQLSVQKKYRS
ncbi:hypothetical protein KGM_208008 [Danaus plexippus plexippus]|uniref:Uncharacterized protein n=1 Tax=Danaus plexippus plexippus TaxID=278856 RepID=A0A212F4J6_DANPL|nr:hypothetical protein KGM_208008 [Danaus plexippus plexippus]